MPRRDVSTLLLCSAGAAAIAASVKLSLALTRMQTPQPREIIPSPRTTLLPQLSPAQTKALGYPPDALPGARDISTPYGSMRVYEWGPEDGRKAVLIHGDATPSPMFSPIAKYLVAKGCRVLTFDLYGRGYSDTPSGMQHESRLYIQQIMYAITSSPIQWTGTNRFSMVGFSMGASIAFDFFGSHPSMIESIVLLGPGGLIRALPDEYVSFFFRYPGLTTTSTMRRLIGTLLGAKLNNAEDTPELAEKENPEGFTPAGAVQFQFDHHQGHVESMLSNVQYGPIQHQHEVWKKACRIITGEVKEDTPQCDGRILVICGEDDSVILTPDVLTDLNTYLGEMGKHWEFSLVPGNHGFPWPEGERVGERIAKFWGLE